MARYAATIGDAKRTIEVEEREGQLSVTVEGVTRTLTVRTLGPGRYSWIDGTRVVSAEVEKIGEKLAVTLRGETITVDLVEASREEVPVLAPAGRRASGPTSLRAPMAGRVVKLLARPGDPVKAGQGVVVIEAMKMENEVRATREGRLRELKISEGAAVESGEELAVLE
jgi:biotin carboxyl carrier protein